MKEVEVRIRRACSGCEGHGRLYMKAVDGNGDLMPGGVGEWYDCPICHNKAEERHYQEWISLSDLKELLKPGMKKDGIQRNASD